ncbi:MAG: hypothetical protein ABI624_16800 [Casimicrobiaceae bacterium]
MKSMRASPVNVPAKVPPRIVGLDASTGGGPPPNRTTLPATRLSDMAQAP